MPRAERTSANSPSLVHRFLAGWARLTPWWWVYLPLVVFASPFYVLYFAGWGDHNANYLVIRLVTFIAVAIFAVDQARHKAFYLRRSQRPPRDRTPGTFRRMIGWALAAITLVFAASALGLFFSGNDHGGRSFLLVGGLIGLGAGWLLKWRPPKWL